MPKLPLAFQLKHIGDFLNTLPALIFMKKHFSEQTLSLVLNPKVAELAQAFPLIDEVLILDKKQNFSGKNRSFLNFYKKVSGKHSSALIFDGQARSVLTAALLGIKKRIGSSDLYPIKSWPRFLYSSNLILNTQKNEESNDFPAALKLNGRLHNSPIQADESWRLKSQAVRNIHLAAAALGLKAEGHCPRPVPAIPLECLDKAKNLLSGLSGSGPIIGLTLQGLQYEKSWPLINFIALAKLLWHKFQARLFVTGGSGEKNLAETLASAAGVPIYNFCGQTSLLDLLAIANLSDLFICVDTGTSHIVALTDTPLISIFIWTSPALWPPQTPFSRILCYDWALKRFSLKAQEGPWRVEPHISPQMVFEEATLLLNK